MGSLERKMKRKQLRLQHELLGPQWAEMKRNQEQRLAKGEDLQKGEQKLGKKPPFGHFVKRAMALEQMAKDARAKAQQERREAEAKIDLEWKEE